jgi:DNA-binding CsgD family transcriptional regulator
VDVQLQAGVAAMTAYVRARRTRLTDRESEVLGLVAQGMTNAEIGRALHITEETVKRHMRELRFVLRARDRAHAVDRGWRLGYLGGGMSEVRNG